MANMLIYKIPDSFSDQSMISEISNKFSIQKDPPIHHRQTFFDTFDWRLFNNGFSLIRERDEYSLTSLQTGTSSDKSIAKSERQSKFWWDFPDGSLKDTLKKHLDVRALVPIAEIEILKNTLRIVNQDQKTVVRIDIENCHVGQEHVRNELINCITLLPVKGYDKEFADAATWLKEQGINEDTKPVFLLALEAAGKTPGDYSSKLNLALHQKMTARDATKVILQFLSGVIKANVDGVKSDIDTEFLHDFRVAIRRTRSALSQIRGVFPGDIRDRFKGDFAILQKASNHMRDLDVYLLNKENYQQMLPEHLRSGLEPFFKQVQTERNSEHKKLVRVISANSYTRLIQSWDAFLISAEELPATKNSQKPVVRLAQKFIAKAFHQVINAGNKIQDDSPASELHQLRIEAKKLRYLLEFFASLFPEQEILLLIRQLKKLQDNLGNYNDLSIQQKSLKSYLESIAQDDPDSQKIASAIGGLIAGLYQQQQNIRSAFAGTFAEFRGQNNEEICKKLFA